MQLIPGVLLGQDFGQTLLEKNADRHMLRQGAQRWDDAEPHVISGSAIRLSHLVPRMVRFPIATTRSGGSLVASAVSASEHP